jgi:hypothetical protein
MFFSDEALTLEGYILPLNGKKRHMVCSCWAWRNRENRFSSLVEPRLCFS